MLDRSRRTRGGHVDWVGIVLIGGTGLLWVQPAHAYIDAGTGGLLIQLLLAGIAGAGVLVRMYWLKIKAVLARREK